MRLLAGLLALSLCVGCASRWEEGTAKQPESWVESTNQLAVDCYRQLSHQPGNLIFSPYGVGTTLALVGIGAEGDTLKAFRNAVHMPPKRLVIEALASQAPTSQLQLNSSLWVNQGQPLTSSYKEAIGKIGVGQVQQVDFAGNGSAVRDTINQWASEKSHGRIRQLLEPQDLDASTKLVAADLVYFKAPWLFPFDPALTAPHPFLVNGSQSADVPMMRQEQLLQMARLKQVTWVEIPYATDPKGQRQLMLLIAMPDTNRPAFESSLSWSQIRQALEALQSTNLNLMLPRWQTRLRQNWNQVLKNMGLGVAFSEQADFSGIDGAQDLALGQVVEEAWISVDEAGTEAASGSAASLIVKAVQGEPIPLIIDRPFIFFIYDRASEQILFMGRLLDPRA
jgi:serpin B